MLTYIKQLMETDALGFTPMHFSAYLGWKDAIIELIDEGLEINTESNRGLTPLDAARISGNVEAIALILRFGGRVSSRSIDWKVKMGYQDWLDARSTEYIVPITKLLETKRVTRLKKNARHPRRIIPIPLKYVKEITRIKKKSERRIFNLKDWHQEKKQSISKYRDSLLRNVRENIVDNIAA